MDKARWERAAVLFDALCELDASERAQQLDLLAAEDAALAAELRAMLAADLGASPLDRGIGEQRVPGNALTGLLETFFDAPVPMNVNIEEETAARDTGLIK